MDITMILLAVFVLFMIWSIYSGTKRQKAQMQATQTMQENLRAGDEIMTRAGLYGTIVSTDRENRKALVEIAEGTIITISLDAVATVVDVAEEEPVEAKEEAVESTEAKDAAEDESPEKPAKGYDLN
ncbi:preprotein translocase subunit YajC [Rothia aeria]|uniref:preprotein translocase subunit YajC n=1 Tax=Rothia aeria TaxID=172042 RepID=UPI00288AB1EC|nr:preprotein translocase subunit YajC [Rothia aeria]